MMPAKAAWWHRSVTIATQRVRLENNMFKVSQGYRGQDQPEQFSETLSQN